MVGAAPRLRDYVVNLEDSEGELRPAVVADAFLLAEQDVLVLAVGNRGVNVRVSGYFVAGGDVAMVEQASGMPPIEVLRGRGNARHKNGAEDEI